MKFLKNRKGNIAVMASLTMPIIVGGAGLGVETGYWYYEQLHLQQAADAAAYAAALEHYQGNEDEMLSSATEAAERNSYDEANDDIAMTWPSASFASDERSVDIALTREIPRGFTAIFGSEPITVAVKATAKYEPTSQACLLALSKSSSDAVWIQGNGTMSIAGCLVSANSLAIDSISTQGAADATVPCLYTAGGVEATAALHMTECTSALTEQLPVADPYKDVELPAPGTCKTWEPSANHTPGTYCASSIAMNGRNHTFAAGTYIFNGTDVTVTGGAGAGMTCTGGCTFIFLNGATIQMSGSPPMDLIAPSTGPYAGMLFMSDRTGAEESFIFNGNSTSRMTGTFYLPNDLAKFEGTFAGFNGCTQVVANRIHWSGNASLSVDCTAYGMGTIQVGGRPYLVG